MRDEHRTDSEGSRTPSFTFEEGCLKDSIGVGGEGRTTWGSGRGGVFGSRVDSRGEGRKGGGVNRTQVHHL